MLGRPASRPHFKPAAARLWSAVDLPPLSPAGQAPRTDGERFPLRAPPYRKRQQAAFGKAEASHPHSKTAKATGSSPFPKVPPSPSGRPRCPSYSRTGNCLHLAGKTVISRQTDWLHLPALERLPHHHDQPRHPASGGLAAGPWAGLQCQSGDRRQQGRGQPADGLCAESGSAAQSFRQSPPGDSPRRHLWA